MKRLAGLCALTLLAAACGSVDDGGGGGPDAGANPGADADDGPDTTAPTILSMTPADGATGVAADAVVVIEFSEPMDQLSVQNSLDTSDLGGVRFEWSNGGATVTIIPDEPLAYAEGDDPDTTDALAYVVVIGTGASDEVGNPVEIGAQTRFTTLRQISTTIGRDNDLTAAGTPESIITDADDFLQVGDDGTGGLSKAIRSFITMDLSALPETAVDVVTATLKGNQLAVFGQPYIALGAGTGVIIEHLTFTLGTDLEVNAAFNADPMAETGVFANSGDTGLLINVTDEVADDLANRAARNNRSQFRLRLSVFTNLDDTEDKVIIGRDDLALDLVYLMP